MSKFRVGQRVRIVGCAEGNYMGRNIGKTGVIVRKWRASIRQWICGESRGGPYWIVDVAPVNDSGDPFGWAEKHLSPCAYDGNEKVSWSECLWQPTPERVA